MNAMHASFSRFWTDRVRAGLGGPLLVCAIASQAAFLLALEERTYYMREVAANEHLSWYALAVVLSALGFVLVPRWNRAETINADAPPRDGAPLRIALAIGCALGAAGPIPIELRAALIGVACALLAGVFRAIRPYERPLVIVTMGGLSCILAYAVATHVEARFGNGWHTGWIVAGAVRMLGGEAWSDGALASIRHEGTTHRILVSPDKFGIVYAFTLAAGTTVAGALLGLPRRVLAGAALMIALFSAAIGLWVTTSSVMRPIPASAWWTESFLVTAYAPVVAMVGLVFMNSIRRSGIGRGSPRTADSRIPGALASVAALLLATGWLWVDPGTAKTGRVVVDEHFSAWEPSDEPLTTERFGVRTVYAYFNLVNGLGHHFDVARNYEPITDATLENASVLILKTPTSPYPQETIDRIEAFVRDGGGLWMIGDHTDVFGMTTHLRPVAERFGLRLDDNAVLDVQANRQLYEPEPWAHPVARHMPRFIWMTGHSVSAPMWSRDAIRRGWLLCDNSDHSANTGFGDFAPQLDERIGQVTQCVAMPFGNGRVAYWSDSTVFSNFGVFMPGKFEIAVGTVDYLSRSEWSPWLRWLLLGSGALLALVAVGVGRTTPIGATDVALGCLGASAGIWLAAWTSSVWYPPHEPERPFDEAAFVEFAEHPVQQPVLTTFQEARVGNYLQAFIAMQRVGLRPRFVSELAALRDDVRLIMVARGAGRDCTTHDVELLSERVRAGAHLVWLDFGAAPSTTRLAAQEIFDLQIVSPPAIAQPEADSSGSDLVSMLAGSPAGGPVLVDSTGDSLGAQALTACFTATPTHDTNAQTILHLRDHPDLAAGVSFRHGNGRVTMLGTTQAFSDAGIGYSSGVPNSRQLRTLQELFAVLEHQEPTSSPIP
ncbi:MAG: hypothetical protein AAGD00_08575 [Planctomycetota bacterium]